MTSECLEKLTAIKEKLLKTYDQAAELWNQGLDILKKEGLHQGIIHLNKSLTHYQYLLAMYTKENSSGENIFPKRIRGKLSDQKFIEKQIAEVKTYILQQQQHTLAEEAIPKVLFQLRSHAMRQGFFMKGSTSSNSNNDNLPNQKMDVGADMELDSEPDAAPSL